MNELIDQAVNAGLATFKYPLTTVTARAYGLYRGWCINIRPVLEAHDVIEVESEFAFPLLNPETEAASKTFVEAGKIDGVLRCKTSGAHKVLEHKTTSDSIDPDSDYWARLVMDTQISKYLLSLRQRGIDARTVVYDVVKKPAHRGTSIPILDENGLKVVRDAYGNRMMTKDGKKWRQTGDADLGYVVDAREETPEELASRVFESVINDSGAYYVQKEIPRSDTELLEYMSDAWALGQQILHYRRQNIWPRNPSACTQFGVCEFFDLCAKRADVDGIRYRAKNKAHAELAMEKSGDLELLTNSRLSALRKCSRYHYLKYESPTERVGEESEALAIGTAFHHAAEAFLRIFVVSQ
jgi:hypothetical protein